MVCPSPVELYPVCKGKPTLEPEVVWCGCGDCPIPVEQLVADRQRLAANALFEPSGYQDRLW
jgi:hypothetical protein